MAVEEQQMLIRTGDRLPDFQTGKIYDLPVAFKGFDNLSLVRVAINDPVDIKTLIPDYNYDAKHQANYQVFEAVCVSEAGEPVLAIVKGENIFEDRGGRQRYLVRSIANLSQTQEKVILTSLESRPLENIDAPWPGYSLTVHSTALEAGREILVVEKTGDKFTISFPEGDPKWQ